MSAIYDVVRDAIINRKIVTGTYNGYYREMCPHAIGLKRGREHALFYQFAGQSSQPLRPDGSPNNWRCIDLAVLSGVATKAGDWHTCARHTQRQTCIDRIDVEVGN